MNNNSGVNKIPEMHPQFLQMHDSLIAKGDEVKGTLCDIVLKEAENAVRTLDDYVKL